MTHTNSLVCSETVTEKWRVWVGCGKCVSGPEQYVKACALKCLLQWSQQPPPQQVSSPLLNTWLWCLSSFSRCVSVSHTSLYCCLCSGRPKEQFHNEGKRCVTRWGKCVHVFYERAGEYTCVCKKVYFVHFSPAAFSWKWLENKAPLSY